MIEAKEGVGKGLGRRDAREFDSKVGGVRGTRVCEGVPGVGRG